MRNNYIFCGNQPCEARDGSGNLLSQYFALGQVNVSGGNGTPYFYEIAPPIGNVVGLTNASGVEVTSISYDPWGNATVLAGTVMPDFGFAHMLWHQPSLNNFTKFRDYNPSLGRWLSRDPLNIGSLYDYVGNNPISFRDPLGLCFVPTGNARYDAALNTALQSIAATGDPALVSLLQRLQASDVQITFHPGNEPQFYGGLTQSEPDQNTIAIRWNPAIWGNDPQPGGEIEESPTELLLHELGHTDDFIKYGLDGLPTPLLPEAHPLELENTYRSYFQQNFPGYRTEYYTQGSFFPTPSDMITPR